MGDSGPADERPVEIADEDPEPGPRGYHRLRERIVRHRALHVTWRVTVLAIGTTIVCAGLAMLVLPGPGWAAIFIGLAVLSTEFMWAERLLNWSKQQARRAADRALDPRHRRRNQAILAVTMIGLAVGSWWYVATYGWPAPVQWVLDRF